MRLLSWFRRWLSEGSDPAWKPTGTRTLYSGYEQQKAVAGARKARYHSQTGRAYQTKGQAPALRKVK